MVALYIKLSMVTNFSCSANNQIFGEQVTFVALICSRLCYHNAFYCCYILYCLVDFQFIERCPDLKKQHGENCYVCKDHFQKTLRSNMFQSMNVVIIHCTSFAS